MGRGAGWALGVVMIAAGAAKLASPLWPEQARQLGVARLLALVVPWVELGLGALLLTGFDRRVVAIAAGALLVVFTGLLVLRLAQGRRPPCACFGGRTPRPIGAWSVARNLAFLALAALASFA